MKIGYARVSTADQNESRQIVQLKQQGIDEKHIYLDKLSGKDTNRPQLKAMLNFVREGDTLIVTEYSRLARSVKDLLNIVEELTAKNVQIISLKENFDTSTSTGKLMLTMFAGIAEFERAMIRERQAEGIAIAREQGKYKGRKSIQYDEKAFIRECKKWSAGQQTATETMKNLHLKPNTFYRLVKKHGISKTKETV